MSSKKFTKNDIPLADLVQRWERRETQAMMSPADWSSIITIIRKLLPEYAVRDFTNLENDHCYIVEVLLHEGETSFLDDGVELLTKLGGKARVMQTFVSQIAPYSYYYVWEMSTDSVGDDLVFAYPKRTELLQRDKQIAFLIERLLSSFGYKPLHPRTAAAIVPGIETECLHKGKVAVFHLLFSELFSVR